MNDQTEADFREIERDRDLPPDEPYARGEERWPRGLMHAETCAWRFGNTACDCGLEAEDAS